MRQVFIKLFAVFSSLGVVIGLGLLLGWAALLLCPALALATLVFSSEAENSVGKRKGKGKSLQLPRMVPDAVG